MKRRWLIGSIVTVATVAAAAAQESATSQERVEQGRSQFVEQGCHGCHTVGKLGTPIGPDLSHVGSKYSESYLRTWLRDPAAQRPAAHMPKLELTETQIAALASFLGSLR